MADDDFSDSGSSAGSDGSVTDVLLGLADGPLEGDDEANPLVSRIGGRAVSESCTFTRLDVLGAYTDLMHLVPLSSPQAWLPLKSPPPRTVAQCNFCKQPMELLVQIFAPLEDSPHDRIMLIWGCSRAPCQRKGPGR